MSYSIWLQPAGPLAKQLAGQIDSLASRYGTDSFRPHVTLIGAVDAASDQDMLQRSKQLAASLKSYSLRLRRVACSSTFYQCVFLLCDKEGPVAEAASKARQHFGMDAAEYMPHLSLLYADIDQASREALVSELQGSLCSGPSSLADQEFAVDALIVWRTPAGQTTSWHHLDSLPLQ